MVLVYFLAALLGIVVLALVVNRLTGTKASYLETFELAAGERELWRDEGADFATRPSLGQAAIVAYPRLRRHSVVWTTQRILVAQKPLFSERRMLTHQLVLASLAAPNASQREAAGAFGGGFYGRGFATVLCSSASLAEVDGKPCIRFEPSSDSAGAMNLAEAYVFSDRLQELKSRLPSLA